jgi:hypothetical protein
VKDREGIWQETAHSPTLSKAAMCGSAKPAEPNSPLPLAARHNCGWRGASCRGVVGHVLGWLALHSGVPPTRPAPSSARPTAA